MDEEFSDTADGVSWMIDSTDTENRGVYANQEWAEDEGTHLHTQRGDSSDEVDPRRLLRDPTLSEIRWYYRRTFAKVLVNKPIDDAFKNGFEFTSENDDVDTDWARNTLENPRWDGEGDGYVGAVRFIEKKARRDGFALLFLGTRERGSAGIHESPISEDVEVDRVTHLKPLTIDDLTNSVPSEQIEAGTGLEEDEYRVRDTGIVINTDIRSPDYRTPVGYVLDGTTPQFIHADRVQHFTWHPEVDGDYDSGEGIHRMQGKDSLGQFEGDSVLIPSYDLLKGLSKGNWAIMQALFRNASHMYSVKLPKSADDEDFSNAVEATQNINAKSALIWPDTDYEIAQHESGGEMEPEQHYEVIFDQVCACHEMTKSVLFGTQSGTVSGSETDIKNYFNKVERYRTNRGEDKLVEFLTMARRMEDSRTSEEYEVKINIEWGPMFEVDQDTKVQMMQNEANALTTLIGSYAMTPDEAREILTSEYTDIDLDDLSEGQMDVLDRINLTNMGQGQSAIRSEREYTNAPEEQGGGSPSANAAEGGRSGGREQGQLSGDAIDALERLASLYEDGLLAEDEFEAAKDEVLQ